MKKIKLTQGKVTLVDDDVYKWAREFKWFAHKCGRQFYAARNSLYRLEKRQHKISLHREIMKAPSGLEVDHINGDSLDNQRSNLRLVTHQQNQMGHRRKPNTFTSSKFRGVCWHKATQKWQVRLRSGGKTCYYRLFECEMSAAKAYNIAARKFFGEFAHLNLLKRGRP